MTVIESFLYHFLDKEFAGIGWMGLNINVEKKTAKIMSKNLFA